MKRARWLVLVGATVGLVLVAGAPVAQSHCQIPCGIYGDDARFEELAEHIRTIEKSMAQIQ